LLGEIPSVDVVLNSQLKQQIVDNRKRILPIIDTVILCGRQGLALRGDGDHGNMQSLEDPLTNDGNFRALLRYRANGGDEHLVNQLLRSGLNATYISSTIQNEVIHACNDLILADVVEKVNAAHCFSVLADETADISGTEQFALCVRYMDCDVGVVREDFLQFVPVFDVTGKSLATVLNDSLIRFGIDVQYLRGQGYDGAAAMSGRLHGAQSYVRALHPLALYVHCGAHSLNLAISDACAVAPIRNCLGTIGSVYNFLNTPKRLEVLRSTIERLCPGAHATRLVQMCPTRWVQRHDSVIVFIELLKAVIDCLETISEWRDRDSSSGASQLLSSVMQSQFLVSIHVVAKIFAVNIGLCRFLQKENVDLLEALNCADSVLAIVQEMRENADSVFAQLFATVAALCSDIDVELVKPRVTKRQTCRNNFPAETPEEYFRAAVFIPFADSFCVQLQDRLLKHRNVLSNFMCLLPDNLSVSLEKPTADQLTAVQRLAETYAVDVQCSSDVVAAELHLWYRQVAALEKPPKNAVDGFVLCNGDLLPSIKKLLQVMATLPVTTCNSERSFSSLRRIKTYLRSTMGVDRLNGLAVLNIHRDIRVSSEQVLDKLCEQPRRMPFRLM